MFGCGTVFELTPPETGGAWTETVILNADTRVTFPDTSLIIGHGGALYGGSGYARGGTVYELKPPSSPGGPWALDLLSNLSYYAPTSLAGGGKPGTVLFGTTWGWAVSCANQSCGTVFEATPPTSPHAGWAITYLYAFTGANGDGIGPTAGLVVGRDGSLYGTTFQGGFTNPLCNFGGVESCGTVFELTPPTAPGAWTEQILYSFTGQNGDGALPMAGLTMGEGGALFGTTAGGGSGRSGPCSFNSLPGCGTVFKLTPPAAPGGAWTETVIHSFAGTDGSSPEASLLEKKGVLYGTTYTGGPSGNGTVFELTP
jgi:uncharacterized repeat protein (TIGR03803 family)